MSASDLVPVMLKSALCEQKETEQRFTVSRTPACTSLTKVVAAGEESGPDWKAGQESPPCDVPVPPLSVGQAAGAKMMRCLSPAPG